MEKRSNSRISGTHDARERHGDLGQCTGEDIGDRFLVGGIGVAVQKAHGHALDRIGRQAGGERLDRREVERRQDFARRVHAFRHRQAPTSRHQRLRAVDVDVVLLEAVLEGHLEHVAVALGRDQGRSGTAAFDQRIGRQRGSVQHDADVTGLRLGPGKHLLQAPRNAGRRLGVRGQDLGRHCPAAGLEDDVRERATDVYGDPVRHGLRSTGDGVRRSLD